MKKNEKKPGRRGWMLILALSLTGIAFGASPEGGSKESSRSTISLAGPWQISPIQHANNRPADRILSSSDPVTLEGNALNWSTVILPTLRGFYQDAPPEVFPQAPGKSYWFGAFRASTYNWAWYRRTFSAPKPPANDRVYLSFMAVAWEAHIWINGQPAGMHQGSFTGFDLDITDLIKPDSENTVTVLAVADFGVRPVSHVYGKMFYPSANMAGVIGPVSLEIRPSVFIRRILIAPNLADSSVTMEDWIENRTSNHQSIQLRSVLHGPDQALLSKPLPENTLDLAPGVTRFRHIVPATQAPAWSPEHPALCTLTTSIYRNGEEIDNLDSRFGFRDFSIRDGQFFLNGHRIRLYFGNILTFGNFKFYDPADQTRFRDWLRRQKAQNVNVIRYQMGGIDSWQMLRLCDEEGMLVMDEWPWYHRVESAVPEGPARDEFFRHNDAEMKEWIYRDFNSPSNIFWSLANEVWTKPEVPLLEHAYSEMKKVDWSGRPMSISSGFHSVLRTQAVTTDIFDFHNYSMHSEDPWSLIDERVDGDMITLQRLYGKIDKPAIISESLNITPIPKVSLLQITPGIYLQNASLEGVREIGLRAAADPRSGTRDLESTFGMRVLEQFRQDTRLQGFNAWFSDRTFLPEAIREIYGPYYVGVRDLPPHLEGGKPWKINVLAIRDPMERFAGQVSLRVVDASAKTLWEKTADVNIPADQQVNEQSFTWPVPSSLAEGRATLSLDLKSQGKVVATRSYPILLFPQEHPHLSVAAGRRVGLWDPSASPSSLATILADVGVKIPVVRDFSTLSMFDVLILGNGWNAQTLPDVKALRKWMEGGGRLVTFESNLNGDIPWAPGYNVLHTANTRQPFVDLVVPDHPIFSHLTPECFDGWNGNGELVTDSLIQPLSVNVLAAAGSYGHLGQLSAVMEAAVGKGSFLLTELPAVERYDTDPVAGRFVRNVLDYALEGNPRNPPPLAKVGQNKALAGIANTPPEKFAQVDLRHFVNKPLLHTLGDLSPLDYSQLPVGLRTFLGVPFDIIDPGLSQNRAVLVMQGNYTPELPQRVTGIPINCKASYLCFLQAAYHAGTHVMAHYLVHYDDRTVIDIPLNGTNLGDWFNPGNLEGAPMAWSAAPSGASSAVGLFLFPWKNPKPDKVISTIDVLSEGAEQDSGASLLLVGITIRKP